MTALTTGLRGITLVCVPTSEQDQAVEFYERIGFEKRTDEPFGGDYRWIEVYPPEGSTGIALAPPPPGSGDVVPAVTGITLSTHDIDATHAQLKALGVDVDAEVSRMGGPVPPLFWFRDPSGHTLMVVEQSERRPTSSGTGLRGPRRAAPGPNCMRTATACSARCTTPRTPCRRP